MCDRFLVSAWDGEDRDNFVEPYGVFGVVLLFSFSDAAFCADATPCSAAGRRTGVSVTFKPPPTSAAAGETFNLVEFTEFIALGDSFDIHVFPDDRESERIVLKAADRSVAEKRTWQLWSDTPFASFTMRIFARGGVPDGAISNLRWCVDDFVFGDALHAPGEPAPPVPAPALGILGDADRVAFEAGREKLTYDVENARGGARGFSNQRSVVEREQWGDLQLELRYTPLGPLALPFFNPQYLCSDPPCDRFTVLAWTESDRRNLVDFRVLGTVFLFTFADAAFCDEAHAVACSSSGRRVEPSVTIAPLAGAAVGQKFNLLEFTDFVYGSDESRFDLHVYGDDRIESTAVLRAADRSVNEKRKFQFFSSTAFRSVTFRVFNRDGVDASEPSTLRWALDDVVFGTTSQIPSAATTGSTTTSTSTQPPPPSFTVAPSTPSPPGVVVDCPAQVSTALSMCTERCESTGSAFGSFCLCNSAMQASTVCWGIARVEAFVNGQGDDAAIYRTVCPVFCSCKCTSAPRPPTTTTSLSTTLSMFVEMDEAPSPSDVGAVVGGVFGGLCVLALCCCIVFVVLRTRRRHSENTQHVADDDETGGGSKIAMFETSSSQELSPQNDDTVNN